MRPYVPTTAETLESARLRGVDVRPCRCGDDVQHRSGETLLVAAVEGDRLYYFGWPEGSVSADDCTRTRVCSDEEHLEAVGMWLDVPHVQGGREDPRVAIVRKAVPTMNDKNRGRKLVEGTRSEHAVSTAQPSTVISIAPMSVEQSAELTGALMRSGMFRPRCRECGAVLSALTRTEEDPRVRGVGPLSGWLCIQCGGEVTRHESGDA